MLDTLERTMAGWMLIERHSPLIAAYLVYHYRAPLPFRGWMRLHKKQLD